MQVKLAEVASWQEVPISVEDITPEVCSVCPSGDTQCSCWLSEMGLGKYCYESYLKYHEKESEE